MFGFACSRIPYSWSSFIVPPFLLFFYHNVRFRCVELKKIPLNSIKKKKNKHSCWHGKKKEKRNFLFHSLQLFLNDFNIRLLRRSKTAVLISIFSIYWNLKKKKSISFRDTSRSAGGAEGRDKQKGNSIWMRRSFRFTCEYTEAAGVKADTRTCTRARESGTLSDVP